LFPLPILIINAALFCLLLTVFPPCQADEFEQTVYHHHRFKDSAIHKLREISTFLPAFSEQLVEYLWNSAKRLYSNTKD